MKLIEEFTECVPSTGRFYRKILPSREPGDIRFGSQPIAINTLSKYLKTMCLAAIINFEERRFTNHSGKVTCATRLYERGNFDEQMIMSRTGHRSTAVRSYKRPSSTMVKPVSDALQPPAIAETDSKKQTVSKDIEKVKIEKTNGSPSTNMKHRKTNVSFRFELMLTS